MIIRLKNKFFFRTDLPEFLTLLKHSRTHPFFFRDLLRSLRQDKLVNGFTLPCWKYQPILAHNACQHYPIPKV
jgi:hypothetical protein